MSIASEITRLQTAKADLKTSIENKGVAVSSSATLDEYPALVDAIPTGGGGLEPKLVNFIDYDGTLLHSYDDEEFAELTALPSNPTHTDMGLVADGWNWTLAEIRTQLTAMPDQKVWVGQMYHTASGATEIDLNLFDADILSIKFEIVISGGTLGVDWGDGVSETLSASITKPHTYASVWEYTIKFTPSSENVWYCVKQFNVNLSGANQNYITRVGRYIKAIRLGEKFSISQSNMYLGYYTTNIEYITIPYFPSETQFGRFMNYSAVKSMTIPKGITTIVSSAFIDCYYLKTYSLPPSITTINSSCFSNNIWLKNITLPYSLETIDGTYTFRYSSIEELTVPSTVTVIPGYFVQEAYSLKKLVILGGGTLGANMCYQCKSLESLTIPINAAEITSSMCESCSSLREVNFINAQPGITKIGASAFVGNRMLQAFTIPQGTTQIGNNAFANNNTLSKITFPSSVTSIGNFAFSNCYGLREIKFESTTPPTLGGTSVFQINATNGAIIYVPSGTLSAYTTATNYPSTSTYHYIEY